MERMTKRALVVAVALAAFGSAVTRATSILRGLPLRRW